jgi:hypothetical protein
MTKICKKENQKIKKIENGLDGMTSNIKWKGA